MHTEAQAVLDAVLAARRGTGTWSDVADAGARYEATLPPPPEPFTRFMGRYPPTDRLPEWTWTTWTAQEEVPLFEDGELWAVEITPRLAGELMRRLTIEIDTDGDLTDDEVQHVVNELRGLYYSDVLSLATARVSVYRTTLEEY